MYEYARVDDLESIQPVERMLQVIERILDQHDRILGLLDPRTMELAKRGIRDDRDYASISARIRSDELK